MSTYTIQKLLNIKNTPVIYRNLSYDDIFEHEKRNGETILTNLGAMSVDTGIYTGRSPNDKFFVKEPSSENNIWWGKINQPVSEKTFDILLERCMEYLSGKPLYVFDGFVGARKETRMSLRVITEKAWQHHFATNMFIRPTKEELENFREPEFTIINASGYTAPDWKELGLHSEAFVIFHLGRKIQIIGGTQYGGEMKKGIFSVMNYYKPLQEILTMHCSANMDKVKGDTALFFGLSGTGKTTLSTDPKRPLIGDDEHGWDEYGIWNLEGGCYAKCINLNPDDEPQIYSAIRRNALLENIVIRPDGSVDFSDASKTENTRVSYPIFHIGNRVDNGLGSHPKNIIFLTADAFGVLPPVARLTTEQAMYHFLSGYTAKVAGTERGIKEPVATFSACFGAAFLPLHPTKYAKLIGEKINKHKVRTWLVNTGWAGGPYGIGKRMSIKLTRSILDGIFDGSLDHDDYTYDPIMNLHIPNRLHDYDKSVLHPWETWADKKAYEEQRLKLAKMFIENFKQYTGPASEFDYSTYGPKL